MAIPLIIGIAAGAVGLYKGGKAIIDNNAASDINDAADEIVQKANKRLETTRSACQSALAELGQHKVQALEKNVQDFLHTFNQIKNVDFAHDGDLDNMALRDFDTSILNDMAESISMIASAGLGAGGGALSGAAATNATLAWLGGGTIASGGMGVAGGVMALQALVAGPALLAAGWYMGSKAETNLNNARSNKEKARKYEADAEKDMTLANGIGSMAIKASEVLSTLRTYARRNLNTLKTIIKEQGVDYAQYNQEGKLSVMKNVKIMQVIKTLIDTPLLDKDGNLLGDTSSNLNAIAQYAKAGFQGELPQT